jgi:hypothetical protein
MRLLRYRIAERAEDQQPHRKMAPVQEGRLQDESPDESQEHEAQSLKRGDLFGQHVGAKKNDTSGARQTVACIMFTRNAQHHDQKDKKTRSEYRA